MLDPWLPNKKKTDGSISLNFQARVLDTIFAPILSKDIDLQY